MCDVFAVSLVNQKRTNSVFQNETIPVAAPILSHRTMKSCSIFPAIKEGRQNTLIPQVYYLSM
jgi:hypothetical protein